MTAETMFEKVQPSLKSSSSSQSCEEMMPMISIPFSTFQRKMRVSN